MFIADSPSPGETKNAHQSASQQHQRCRFRDWGSLNYYIIHISNGIEVIILIGQIKIQNAFLPGKG